MANNPGTWLDKFFQATIEWASSFLPQRPILQFIGDVSVADNPGNDSTDITIGASNVLETLEPLSAPILASALVTGTRYLVDTSGGSFTQPLPTSGTPVGTWYEFTDATASFQPGGAKNLTVAGGSRQIVDPHFININGQFCAGNNLVLDQVRTTTRVIWNGTIWDVK